MDLAELYHLIIDAHDRDGEGELKELLCFGANLIDEILKGKSFCSF